MAVVHKLTSPYLTLQASIVRSRDSGREEIRAALRGLGEEVGRQVMATCLTRAAEITTPMNEAWSGVALENELSVVITTKFDMETFGAAISATLAPSKVGYMDFEGRRGLDALSSPVREIVLPEIHGRVVDSVVIAKSCLATGCTAVSLAKSAVQEYSPRLLVIVTVFYSREGLDELEEKFPHAHIFVVGDPDDLDGNGMLHPGVGLLEARI
jgi:uracil phosphoribosyltransferase